MSLDNLVLQVNYPGDSYHFSDIIQTMLETTEASNISGLTNEDGNLLTVRRAKDLINAIEESTNHNKEYFYDSFYKKILCFQDFSGKNILSSNRTILFPISLDYRTVKKSSSILVNADYRKNNYIGLIEHIKSRPELYNNRFNYNISCTTVDNFINKHLPENYISLYSSNNYCLTVLEQSAKFNKEIIDLEKSLNFFIGKPISLLVYSINNGINASIENFSSDLKFYQNYILKNYIKHIHHKENTHSVKMKTLILPDRDLSWIAYQKLFEYVRLPVNEEKFFAWHSWLFDGDYCFDETSIPALLNIISKLLLGKKFSPEIWTMEAQIVFNCAVEEKLGITDGVASYQEYINNNW